MAGRHGFVGTGEFGAAVARMLAGTGTDLGAVVAGPGPGDLAPLFAGTDVLIAVLWRPSRRLCERIEDAARRAGAGWLPAVLSFPYVGVGPLVRPGQPPCFRCLTRRQAQHSAPELPDEDLLAAYDADPGLGPTGHLDCHARVTAGLIGWLLRDRDARPGELVRFHLVDRSIDTATVWPWHDCPSCGPGTSADPAARLRAALAGLES